MSEPATETVLSSAWERLPPGSPVLDPEEWIVPVGACQIVVYTYRATTHYWFWFSRRRLADDTYAFAPDRKWAHTSALDAARFAFASTREWVATPGSPFTEAETAEILADLDRIEAELGV